MKMWSFAHSIILIGGSLGFISLYIGTQILTSRFMKNENDENPARVPILISFASGAFGLLSMVFLICLALLW